ncbi:hypothetical protein N7474_010440 [Penicillium riverlandense]|uniref:uncharacterized protein n=1 Tax=Penicillium riverlandense TaxID=1903569 RepID=UPI002546A209|nr:uncharacterized protein N7474_010440 [Penicillium riverlandense]KAJ5806848.1 hypothetical protein N7474_010440 [Penicillium riverlandense]
MANLNKSAAITTARYNSPIPPNVEIAETKPAFAKIQDANLGTLLYAENGGYYLKYPEGEVVAIASDRLCSILDNSHMSLIFYLERNGLHEKAEEVMRDLREAGIDADRLKRDTSDEIKSGACVIDPGLEEDAGDDIQRPKARP